MSVCAPLKCAIKFNQESISRWKPRDRKWLLEEMGENSRTQNMKHETMVKVEGKWPRAWPKTRTADAGVEAAEGSQRKIRRTLELNSGSFATKNGGQHA
jgi:hypothetical protein